MKVYLAGPMKYGHHRMTMGDIAPWRAEIINDPRAGGFKFICPEIIEHCEHLHNMSGTRIPQKDIFLISHSDVMFAYIDQQDRIGTFCEISAAVALKKPVYATWEPFTYPATEKGIEVPWFVNELVHFIDSPKGSMSDALFPVLKGIMAERWARQARKHSQKELKDIKAVVNAL